MDTRSIKFDGTKHYFDPVYKDINVGALLLSGPAAFLPTEDEFVDSTGADTGIDTYAFSVGDQVDGSFEIQHDYKEGTDITFHIHWQGIVAPAGGTDNVKWQLIYTIARSGVALAPASTITKQAAFTTQYAFNITSFDAITGTNIKIGDQLLFRLDRIAADSDEYGGAALVATVGMHYQVDTLGSSTITTK